MKRFLIILFSLLICASVNSEPLQKKHMAVIGLGQINCVTKVSQETYVTEFSFGRDLGTDPIYVWSTFTPSEAFTGYTFYVSLKKAGTPNVDMQLAVCTVSGADPDSCTNADAVVSSSTLTTSYQWIKYNITAGYAFSASTQYGIRLFWNGAVGASDYALWGYDSDESGQYVKYSADGSSWSTQESSGQSLFKIVNCVE